MFKALFKYDRAVSPPIGMEFDDDSDLTSLEGDDGEQRADDEAARDQRGLQSGSDSSLTSEDDYDGYSSPLNGARSSIPATHVSPSRIGSSLVRPTPVAGLRTYGGRKSRSKGRFGKLQVPKRSPEPSPVPEGYESPLTPLPSPSPRKRRAPSSTQRPLSSPMKRVRKRKSQETNHTSKLKRTSGGASGGKMKPNKHASSQSSRSSPVRRKQHGNSSLQSTEPASSISVGPRRRSSTSAKPRSSRQKVWSLETLENLVWVRVDRRNNVIYDEAIESFWWPAMVEPTTSRKKTLRARILFPPSGTTSSVVVTINEPSSLNIVSYKDHSYTINSFWQLPSSSASSRPAGLEELEFRWEEACKKISEEDVRLNDGFPTSLTALLSQPLGREDDSEDKSVLQTSPERPAVPSGGSIAGEPWSPPLPDPNVSIPGEHVLSTTNTKGYLGNFYPAKVIAYVPPASPNVPSRYTVHFMDNFHEDVTRDMFYIYEQDEFGTCKLGKFESVESMNERDGEDELDQDIPAGANNQLVIPEPPVLPSPSAEEFCNLTVLEQSSYIIPILRKIVENDYKPAERRISAFLDGGRERTKMSREAPQKGFLTRSELHQLARIVQHLAMGLDTPDSEMRVVNSSHKMGAPATHRSEHDFHSPPGEPDAVKELSLSSDDLLVKEVSEGFMETMRTCHPAIDRISSILEACHAQEKEQISSLPPSSLPPSSSADGSPSSTPDGVGGDDQDDLRLKNGIQPNITSQPELFTKRSFKDLLNHEKIHFCTDVLLSEAVIQLLLWRAGRRRSIDLLSETEELLLHESGSNLAGELDIAHTVQDLRKKKEKFLQSRLQSRQETLSIGGTRSRPKKV